MNEKRRPLIAEARVADTISEFDLNPDEMGEGSDSKTIVETVNQILGQASDGDKGRIVKEVKLYS